MDLERIRAGKETEADEKKKLEEETLSNNNWDNKDGVEREYSTESARIIVF